MIRVRVRVRIREKVKGTRNRCFEESRLLSSTRSLERYPLPFKGGDTSGSSRADMRVFELI